MKFPMPFGKVETHAELSYKLDLNERAIPAEARLRHMKQGLTEYCREDIYDLR